MNKALKLLGEILTPGVLILAYLVFDQILEETITWDKLSFALFIFICWGFAFYQYKKQKSRDDKDKTNLADT